MRFKLLVNSILLIVFIGFFSLSQATEKGLFWKMESPAGITSYLFGTIHTDDNRVTDFSPSLRETLKNVDVFMMETAPGGNPNLLMMDKDLSGFLTEAEFDQVRELAEFHVMHIGAAMRMKPWLLAVIFDLPKPQTPFAQDNLLMTTSEDLSKEIKGIETAREHFGVMDNFSLEEQLVMLRAVLKRTPEEKERDFERLMKAYLDGDSDKISALDEQITGGMLPKELWAKMRSKLIDERNLVMASRALEATAQKPTFIAVGASHLAGESGLIEAFKKAGYKLTPQAK